ncbi:tetratricopeptide repeat-containing protein [Cyclospora cayetanensis]|uniref:Tetratricopeptide repeat-containing protein n=1 Tax=Cyclospora cayetanensis TaxID=88456 RepID=A0A1D3CZ11_9EIME|nr:tetratricopeptide repeat-containing protein [Cyclospora cayetanensis]
MDAALSFSRVWVRLVSSRPCSAGELRSQTEREQCDCLQRPPADGQSPSALSRGKCRFVAAEVGVTETVADLKSMLLELLPSCFYTHYDLLLHRKGPQHAAAPERGPLLLQDSFGFADLSIDTGDIIDLVPKPWDALSSLLHLRRLSEVLYEPRAIVMRQLPDASDPCGAFGAVLRPVVLQQLGANAAQEEHATPSRSEDMAEGKSSSTGTEGTPMARRQRSNRRKCRTEKKRGKALEASTWWDVAEGAEGGVLQDCQEMLPLSDQKQHTQQLLLLQQSLLPSPLQPKPQSVDWWASIRAFHATRVFASFRIVQLLNFIRLYPGGPPTPTAQLAGHLLWLEAETVEGLRLYITSTENGFCVSSLRHSAASAAAATAPSGPSFDVFPLQQITAPDGRCLPFSESADDFLFDTLAELLCAYSPAFATGLEHIVPELLDADLPLHALPSLQPFLPPFAAETEASFC